MKNTSHHRIIKRTPYQAVLGPISYGLYSLNLPTNTASSIETEEDLERVIGQFNGNITASEEPAVDSNNAVTEEPTNLNNPHSRPSSRQAGEMNFAETDVASSDEGADIMHSDQEMENFSAVSQGNSMKVDEDCPICATTLNIDYQSCHHCQLILHSKCGVFFENNDFTCPLCLRGQTIMQNQAECFKQQTIAAEKMKKYSDERFLPLDVGDPVTVKIPDVDRGPLDWPTVGGIVLQAKKGLYQIGTKHGVIKNWLPRTSIGISNDTEIQADAVPRDITISLRQAAAGQSLNGGQGFRSCNCQAANNRCQTAKCICFSSEMICNSRCHKNLSCTNKDEKGKTAGAGNDENNACQTKENEDQNVPTSTSCNCKSVNKRCKTKKCACFVKSVKCNFRCHKKLKCSN